MLKKKMLQLYRYMTSVRSKDYYEDNNLDKYESLEAYSKLYQSNIEEEKVLTNTEIRFS